MNETMQVAKNWGRRISSGFIWNAESPTEIYQGCNVEMKVSKGSCSVASSHKDANVGIIKQYC